MLILKFSWRNYEAAFPGGIEFQSRTSKGVCMCVGEVEGGGGCQTKIRWLCIERESFFADVIKMYKS